MWFLFWLFSFFFLAAPGAVSGAKITSAPAHSPVYTTPVAVPKPSEKALCYYRQSNLVWCVRTAAGLLVPAVFLVTGFSARLYNFARRLGRNWFFTIGIYFVAFLLLNFIVAWPLEYFWGFRQAHAFGLSNQTFAKWFGDSLKELAVTATAGFLFLWVPYLLLKKSPRRWWLYTGLAAVPLIFFVTLLKPIFIDPLFNDFGRMKNPVLEAKILALAERAGVQRSRVYEVNKSVDTRRVNAYVTGFLGTKRIVLWDTLLAKLDDAEVLSVMGHELGHYALGHVVRGILFSSVLILVALYGIHRAAAALLGRYRERWGFEYLSDIASLPLIVLLVQIFSLVLTPVGLAFSRHVEHEADRFGLELTRDNHAAATGFVNLLEQNLSNPRPGMLYKIWRASHPSIGERIDFINRYRPWENTEPLKYEHLFSTLNQSHVTQK